MRETLKSVNVTCRTLNIINSPTDIRQVPKINAVKRRLFNNVYFRGRDIINSGKFFFFVNFDPTSLYLKTLFQIKIQMFKIFININAKCPSSSVGRVV